MYTVGASTAEAQTRVAVEIAEQFLAVSGKWTHYAVTGIVNAPAMAAAASGQNAPWVDLAQRLGKLAGKLLSGGKGQALVVKSRTSGPDMAGRQFVHTAVQVGLVADRVEGSLNLVNGPSVAKQLGVKVDEGHLTDGQNAIIIEAASHVIKGSSTTFSNGITLGLSQVLWLRKNSKKNLA